MPYTGISDEEADRQTPGIYAQTVISNQPRPCPAHFTSADPLIIYIVRSKVDRGAASYPGL